MRFKKGFTLVELLVGISILILVLLPVLTAIGRTVNRSEQSQSMNQALNLAEERISSLEAHLGSAWYPGGIPFDFEGGSTLTDDPVDIANDPELNEYLPGNWFRGQQENQSGETALYMEPSYYGCDNQNAIGAEGEDRYLNDNMHICINPYDPNNLTNADGVDLSNEKYRVAMALFAARMDPIDALGVYMPELHPESFRFNNSNTCNSNFDGDCPRIDGIEDFGEIVDRAFFEESSDFTCFGAIDSHIGRSWFDFGYIASPFDNETYADNIAWPGYLTYWRMIAANGVTRANSDPTDDNRNECALNPNKSTSELSSKIANSLGTFQKFRRETQVSTVYFPGGGRDLSEVIDPQDARYYRSSEGVLGRLVRVSVVWRAGEGCSSNNNPSSQGLFSRCSDPIASVRRQLSLSDSNVNLRSKVSLNKGVELRKFIPDPDQDPCDSMLQLLAPIGEKTSRLSGALHDGDPTNAFNVFEECWYKDS